MPAPSIRAANDATGPAGGQAPVGLSTVLESLPAAIYLTDADGRITYYNEAAAELWGTRPELGSAQWCGSWMLRRPDGSFLPHDECPMAVAIKTGQALRAQPAVAERPDGTRIPFLAYPTPLFDERGTLIGAVNMLVDALEQDRSVTTNALLSSIVASSQDGIVSKNLHGIVSSWNGAAEEIFGFSADEMVGQSILKIIPPDRHGEEATIIERVGRGEVIKDYETIRLRKDGTLVPVSVTVSPVKDAYGTIVGASKIARDISDRRRAEEQQSLLLREMGHRIKNLLAVTSGLVSMSARTASSPQVMAEQLRGRLTALAVAQELTRPGLTAAAVRASAPTLSDIIAAVMQPYAESDDGGRVRIEVGQVPVSDQAMTSVALAFHELATNAAKYGALSVHGGSVSVLGRMEDGNLRLDWVERGGPPVDAPPTREGFGSVLVRRTIAGMFGGKIDYSWDVDGLTARMVMPADRLLPQKRDEKEL
jgi:PAS domain S-box-containing protein